MARPDPRAEPESLPPTSSSERSVERIVVTKIKAKEEAAAAAQPESSVEPKAEATGPTGDPGASEPRVDPLKSTGKSPKADPKPITSDDPRIGALQPLVERNDWKLVAEQLGGIDAIGRLPPNLGLIAAIAHNEAAKEVNNEARNVAIRCMASLMGMSEDSELVKVIARRLLRKNPVRFRERPAPPAKTSALIVGVVLVVGGALGWFLSSGTFQRLLRMLQH